MQTSFIDLMRELQGGDSQERFARRIGVAQRTISAIYCRQRRPGEKVLRGMARAYPERASELQALFLSAD